MTTIRPTFTHRLIFVLVISCLCIWGYSGLIDHPWSYDDLDHIQNAQKAQSNFFHVFSTGAKESMRFVLNTYFYLLYPILGESSSGYHTVSILFHILNSLLCARLCLALFSNPPLAALCGLLFAIHGAHYGAIYRISASGYLLGTTFVLLSVLCALKYLNSGKKIYTIWAAGAYTASIFSYEVFTAVLFPLLFLWWERKKSSNLSNFLLPAVLSAGAACFFLIDTLAYDLLNEKVGTYRMKLGLHSLYIFFLFICRLFANAHTTPFGWTLQPPMDMPREYGTVYAIGGVLILALLSYLSRKQGPIRFFSVWIVITILPYTLGTGEYYFTRYWYLPAIGAAALTAHFILWLYSRLPHPMRPGRLSLAVLLLLITIYNLSKINTYEGYYLIDTANYHASPHHRDDCETAIPLYIRARQDNGIEDFLLSYNLGVCYLKMHRLGDALALFREVVHLKPDYAKAFIRVYKEAVQMDPARENSGLIYYNLGVVYQNQNRMQEAEQAYIEALAAGFDGPDLYKNLGILMVEKQQWKEAIDLLNQAVSRDSTDLEVRDFLIQAHQGLNRKYQETR